MSDKNLFLGGFAAIGAAAVAAFFMVSGSSQQAVAAEDGPGPNLVIEVAGQANGTIVIDMLPDVAPMHVEQVTALAREGAYDGVVFHRVIPGFMAQTGDVQNGRKEGGGQGPAGTGGSERPDLNAEFSDISYERGIVGMARARSPNSANSQFFIMFAPAPHLNGQYTVIGRVIEGMDTVDAIKLGTGNGGTVQDPDHMVKVTVAE